MIELKVSAATPVETAQQLKDFAGLIMLPGTDVEKATKSEATSKTPDRKSKVDKKSKVVKNTKSEPEDDEIEGLESETEITLDDIKLKATQLKREQGNGAVRTILEKFDAERVTLVDEDDYVDFYAALEEALGA